jgi:protein-S-isoprenylcysteine O-methyltransferase Ste14
MRGGASAAVLFVKNLVFTVLVPGSVAGLVPYGIAQGILEWPRVDPLRLVVAAPCFLVGAAVYFWCLWDFAVTGRGTPAPIDPPRELVVRGLYRCVRNPMYLGVLLVIAGWTVLSWSGRMLGYGVAVALLFHLFVRLVEEPLLRRRFGAAYEAYCRTVGRWLPGRVDFGRGRSTTP